MSNIPKQAGYYHLATNQFGNAFMAGPNASGDYVKASDYADLAARVERLEAALRFYADDANWHEIGTENIECNPLECKAVVMVPQEHDGGVSHYADCGDTARKALEAK